MIHRYQPLTHTQTQKHYLPQPMPLAPKIPISTSENPRTPLLTSINDPLFAPSGRNNRPISPRLRLLTSRPRRRKQILKPLWRINPPTPLPRPLLCQKEMQMRSQNASEINGCLDWARDNKVQGEEDPGVIEGGDVDNVDVDGRGGMQASPAVGYCSLYCSEE